MDMCQEMLSSGHDMAIVDMNSEAAQDLHKIKPVKNPSTKRVVIDGPP